MSDLTILVLNVTSLPKKFRHMLSVPCQVFALSEVRTPRPTIVSISRQANFLGFSAIWSCPPPPSATCSVSPGGTALFVKRPLTVQEQRVPALGRWRLRGRVCVGRVSDAKGTSVIMISAYGIPPGHQDRGLNEDFLRDLVGYLASLTCPSLLMGDLNTTRKSSAALSLSEALSVFHYTPAECSTVNRSKGQAKSMPIDHVLGNKHSLDLGIASVFEQSISISDHVPIVVRLHLCSPEFAVVDWPKSWNKALKVNKRVPWTGSTSSFQQWNEMAVAWIREATSESVPDKGAVSVKKLSWVSPPPPRTFYRLVKLRRAILEITKHGETPTRMASLKKKACGFSGLQLEG